MGRVLLGTLVAPDVVLTAAHCTDFFTAAVGEDGFGPDDLRVSFDVAPDESSTYYVADHIVVHPDWLTAGPRLGNSKHLCLASAAEDIALVFLQGNGLGRDAVADRRSRLPRRARRDQRNLHRGGLRH